MVTKKEEDEQKERERLEKVSRLRATERAAEEEARMLREAEYKKSNNYHDKESEDYQDRINMVQDIFKELHQKKKKSPGRPK